MQGQQQQQIAELVDDEGEKRNTAAQSPFHSREGAPGSVALPELRTDGVRSVWVGGEAPPRTGEDAEAQKQ